MNFFKARDGAKLFYRDIGTGAPIILIHGWPLNADMWENQTYSFIQREFRVITYDRRGFGRSAQTATGYDYDTFADDLNALIDHLGLKKVALVGFSMGGGEVARYLSRHGSARVSSATLISFVAPYIFKDASNPEGVDGAVFDEMIKNLKDDRPKFLSDFNKQFFGINVINHPVSAETQQWCLTMALQASLLATIECVNAFSRTDFRTEMRSFNVPTLVIHGASDKTVPIATSGAAAAKMIPGSTYKVYDGAPHGLFITHREKLNHDLREFIEAHHPKDIFGSSAQGDERRERWDADQDSATLY